LKSRTRSKISKITLLSIAALLTVAPFYIMLVTSTKDQTAFVTNFWGISFPFEIQNYTMAWKVVKNYIVNSFTVTMLTCIGILIVSIPAGYAFAKLPIKNKEKAFTIVMAFQMIPITLLLVPMFINILHMGLNDSHWGVILPNIATGSILSVILVRSFFEGIPDSIFESARLDGAHEVKIMLNVVIPMSKPIIGTVLLFNFFSYFNQFMWPFIVLSSDKLKTIPIGLMKLSGQYGVNFGLQMAAYTIVSVPLVILIVSTMKVYVSGITSGAVKG